MFLQAVIEAREKIVFRCIALLDAQLIEPWQENILVIRLHTGSNSLSVV